MGYVEVEGEMCDGDGRYHPAGYASAGSSSVKETVKAELPPRLSERRFSKRLCCTAALRKSTGLYPSCQESFNVQFFMAHFAA